MQQKRHSTHGTMGAGRPLAHATQTGKAGAWDTRRVAVCALFCAVAIVLSFIELPIFPAAPYLKYDPSTIICLIAGMAYGPATGAIVAVLPWVIHLFVEPFGAIMAMACAVAATLPAAFIYQRNRTRTGAIIGLAVAGVAALAVAILGNIVITPLYSGMPVEAVIELIVPVLLPFNVIKILINSAVTLLIYKHVRALVQS